ncbi:hypothetical protein ACEPAG_2951 [Sanghuangporus baumii]
MPGIKPHKWTRGVAVVADSGTTSDVEYDSSDTSVYISSDVEEGDSELKQEDVWIARDVRELSQNDYDSKKDASQEMEQSAEALLADLVRIRGDIQEALLGIEYDSNVIRPCACGRENKLCEYRCYDCARVDVVCDLCLMERHRICPFHHAEKWTGDCFQRIDLSALGFVFYLGHRGLPCPSTRSHNAHGITVCHTNGFHFTKVSYCVCAGKSEEAIQLVKNGLFPASRSHPRTAFSHAVLRAFHIDTIVSKKSGYDYMEMLRKLTNNYVPTSDVFMQFMRITHFWNSLCAERWSGRVFRFDDRRLGRPEGSWTIPCLACPVPGFNTADNLSDSFTHAKFLSMDANFHLIGLRKKDRNNQSEEPMWDGRGYVRRQKDIQEHLLRFSHVKEEKSDCSEFTAIQNALLTNSLKHKGQYASGQVAVLCRHGLVIPEGVVNLQQGERHINVDLALSGALKSSVGIPRINLSYDINCQYSKRVIDRFREQFPDQTDIVRNSVRFYIGTFHVVGHKPSCQYRFSLGYASGTGRTDGEEVERYWSEMNQVSGSVKQMTPGHRSDTLDVFNAGWNWSKLLRMSDSIYDRYRDALKNSQNHGPAFDEFQSKLRKAYSDEVIETWARMSTEAELDPVSKEWKSVFKLEKGKGTISGASKLGVSRRLNGADRSPEDFVYIAIKIEQKQMKPSEYDNDKRRDLCSEIQRWGVIQQQFMPGLNTACHPSVDNVDTFRLPLPSFFSPEQIAERGLGDLAAVEYKLREAQAYDALSNLRNAIRDYEGVHSMKSKFGHGKYAHTRTGRVQMNATDAKHFYKMEYREAYKALLELGLSADNNDLRALKDEDMYRESLAEPHQLGSGRRPLGWIWTVGWEHLESDELSESLEENRVRWFRARAVRDRWREEVELLEEESQRLIKGLKQMAVAWKNLAKAERTEITGSHSGRSAYMERKSRLYSDMAVYAFSRRLKEGETQTRPRQASSRTPKRRRRKDDQEVKEAKRYRMKGDDWL